jgi:predicted enzyme related to lactoylglutathione lyase
MAQTMTSTASRPVWIDLATKNAESSRKFYQDLFGWKVEVNPDPQYGGYGMAKQGGKDVAGIGPTQSPEQPSAWSLYIGTEDLTGLSRQVEAAGGKVVSPAFDVGDQGRMAVFQDPAGAFISAWESTRMGGFQSHGPNTFGWAELMARGRDSVLPFYERVFGWTPKRSPMPNGPDYVEFQAGGQSVAGASEVSPQVPAGTPSSWLVYFDVDDVRSTFDKAIKLGAREMTPPQSYPGGEFAILTDPQGAAFGLYKSSNR